MESGSSEAGPNGVAVGDQEDGQWHVLHSEFVDEAVESVGCAAQAVSFSEKVAVVIGWVGVDFGIERVDDG